MLGMGWFPDQPGGLNRYLRSLHEALDRLGEEPVAVVFGPAGDAPPRVRVAGLHETFLPRRLARFALETVRASRTADLVDAHFALYALLPGLAAPLRRLPLVVHFQGPWSAESAAAGQEGPALVVKRRVERAVYRRADMLITLSAAFKRLLVTNYGVAPWLVRVLPPGVDLDHFCPGDRTEARSRLGIPEDAWVAVTVRRLLPRTGVDVLLRAWPTVLEAQPRAMLAVAGDGADRVALHAEVNRLGLESSVRFLGRVDEAALVDCYQAADVSVVPSAALEGFGLVVLESLACGIPVIATDAGGLGDFPARLDPSTVVSARDPVALGRRLGSAAAGSSPLPDSATCRSITEGQGWDEVALRHRDLYREVLGRGPARRLRVVYLDHVADLSGGELALARLLPALTGVDAHVILAEDGPLVARLEADGGSVEVLALAEGTRALRRASIRPLGFPVSSAATTAAYVARLSRRLRVLRPDLVHTNSLKAGMYGSLAARLARVPVVWHLHDRIAPDYLPPFAVKLVHAVVRRAPRAIVANSRATLATIPEAGRSQVRAVVASPVPAPVAHPKGPDDGDRPFTVGMVGRLMPWKGQHVFIEAFAKAFAQGPTRAVIVGGPLFGEERYERSLHERTHALGIAERVDFRGHCDDVATELAGFDVLVHASVTPEPFGLVVAEGMAAGLPVVATAAGGPSEIITDEVDGLLVPPDDVAALAQTLRRLAGDLDLRRQLGAAATSRARPFDPQVVAGEMMAVYRQVIRWN